MTEAEVMEAKRLRQAARSVFETQRELVRADLKAASVGKRVTNMIADDGRALAEGAAETANEHKTVIAAGALAVTGWLLRRPIMALAGAIIDRFANSGEVADEDDPTAEA